MLVNSCGFPEHKKTRSSWTLQDEDLCECRVDMTTATLCTTRFISFHTFFHIISASPSPELYLSVVDDLENILQTTGLFRQAQNRKPGNRLGVKCSFAATGLLIRSCACAGCWALLHRNVFLEMGCLRYREQQDSVKKYEVTRDCEGNAFVVLSEFMQEFAPQVFCMAPGKGLLPGLSCFSLN